LRILEESVNVALEAFGKVNIFVGKNNSGKSSILEALCIIKSALTNEIFGESMLRLLLYRRGIERTSYTVREFWHNYETDKNIKFYLKFREEEPVSVEIKWQTDNLIEISFSKADAKFTCYPRIDSVGRGTSSGKIEDILREETITYLQRLMLIDDQLARKLEKHETRVFGRILESRLDKKIAIELKKAYGVNAEGLSYIPFSPGILGKTKLAVVTPKLSIHIDDIGDGAKYTTVILSLALLL